MDLKRVVVTGLGTVTPIGNNVLEYWQSLLQGKNGVCLISRFDASLFKTKFACEVKNFDPYNFLDKKEVRKLDLFSLYALVASEEAYTDSQLSLHPIDADRAGVIWGSGIGGLNSLIEEYEIFQKGDGTPRFNPFIIPKMIADIVSGHISIRHNLRGINFTTTSACASSANSIADAYNYIRFGKADVMITGGSESAINTMGIGGFNAMHALSTRNEDFHTASRPFDKDRDGFVMGEGSGALVIESLEHALKRNAKIYAEIAGAGFSADAYHITSPHPDGNGALRSMINALTDANASLNDISYINAHGTSTYQGDIAEIKAIKNVFGENVNNIYINSTKSMTGHLLGGAAAIEAIACILSVNQNVVHPTINHFTDDPEIDTSLKIVYDKAIKTNVNMALSNSFGFGGHNVSLLFKKFEK